MPVHARNPFLDRRGADPESDPLADSRELPLDRIDANPRQPRQVFDREADSELTESIRAQGVLQPIIVRPVGDRYQIVVGERRVRASRAAGRTTIPARVMPLDDTAALIITITENLQRADLDLEDEARQFQDLITLTGLSGRALAERLGKSYKYVNRRLLLLRYPALLSAVRTGELTQREALERASAAEVAPNVPDTLGHGVPLRTDDSENLAERAELDALPAAADHPTPAHPAPYLGATPDAAPLQRTPWRERPLSSFMDWVARVDVTTVPPQERLTARQQISAAREWLGRLELQLEELGGTELG